MRKKIAVAIGSRANYSSIKSFLTACQQDARAELQIVCYASAVVDNYGNVSRLIADDGFKIDYCIDSMLHVESSIAMAKTTAFSLIELASFMQNYTPDIEVTVGDRFETLATAIAASYSNIYLAHTMGGEVSGSIDESIRHAITKLSHYHFVACKSAQDRVIQMGEDPNSVFNVGCPRIDLVNDLMGKELTPQEIEFLDKRGVGSPVALEKPFSLVSLHPVTTESECFDDIESILGCFSKYNLNSIVLWPNADFGGAQIAKSIRRMRENTAFRNSVKFFKNLPVNLYIKLMARTSCLIGNSSSGIREGCYIGTPVINIGTRQNDRDRGSNTIDLEVYDESLLSKYLQIHLENGRYDSEHIYGSGDSGTRIKEILLNYDPPLQKSFFKI